MGGARAQFIGDQGRKSLVTRKKNFPRGSWGTPKRVKGGIGGKKNKSDWGEDKGKRRRGSWVGETKRQIPQIGWRNGNTRKHRWPKDRDTPKKKSHHTSEQEATQKEICKWETNCPERQSVGRKNENVNWLTQRRGPWGLKKKGQKSFGGSQGGKFGTYKGGASTKPNGVRTELVNSHQEKREDLRQLGGVHQKNLSAGKAGPGRKKMAGSK